MLREVSLGFCLQVIGADENASFLTSGLLKSGSV